MVRSMKLLSKQVLMMLMVLALLMPMVPAVPLPGVHSLDEAQANATPTVNIGDYIQFGKYNNAPILWRVIHKDTNGDPILLADRILTVKAFDAAGSYHTEFYRQQYGSNFYKDSNIRQWLNSSSANSGANTIDWIQNDPSAANMWNGYNPYNTEKGFIADGNFTSTERSLIKPYTHKVLLAGVDQAKKDGGTANHLYNTDIANVVQNYDTNAYFQNVTDSIFMLSVKQLKEWVYDNRGVLGTSYHMAKPTAEAVNRSTYKDATYFNSESYWYYWLNSPYSYGVRTVNVGGGVHNYGPNSADGGIRPALHLNFSSAIFASGGSGTSSNPYVVSGGSSAPADTTAPSAPSNLGANSVSATALTLAWTASTDNVGVTAYDVHNGTTLVGTVTGSGGSAPSTTFNVTGLTGGTSYSFTVRAKDAAGNTSAASSAFPFFKPSTLNIGDYIQFGKYNNAPILWRVIHKDANGDPILFADRILTIKAFDAKGSYHTGNSDRVNYGSNYYPDSNLRQWLNSSSPNIGANTIDWIQNDPSSTNLAYGNNPYNMEKGFLADGNFTAIERSLIKSYTHKVLLSGIDQTMKDGGTENHSYVIYDWVFEIALTNYDTTAFYKNVTDNVFLLSLKQLKEWVKDRGFDVLAIPTKEAVSQSDFKPSYLNDVGYWNYYLNTPQADSSSLVRTVRINSNVQNFTSLTSDCGYCGGVRPALQLNVSSAIFASGGSGTSGNPYVVSGGSSAPADTTAPSAPSNLGASSVSATALTLTWTASTDNVGVTAYDVYNGTTLIGTVTGSGGSAPATTYNVTGLTGGTSYSFTVRAKDAASNTSVSSGAIPYFKPSTLNIGDYIQFGSYNNAPILWRVIHKDANGDPILFADRILTLKTFDAAGSYHTVNSERVSWGSNFYKDSNIRQWLNSSSPNSGANTIDWIQNDPSYWNLKYGNNPYSMEKGFLADGNFTSTERSLIKPYTHKVLLDDYESAKKDGGTANHIYESNIANVVQNYDTTALFQNVTDSIFMLSVKQLKEWVYDNRGVLGTNYHIARLTAEAVTQSTYKDLNSNGNWFYWLNSPSFGYSSDVRTVRADGNVRSDNAYADILGVRPALHLNVSSAIFASGGSGTSSNPYVVSGGSSAPADTTAPSAPSNLGASSVSATALTLAWTASTDNVGVTAYDVYSGTTLIGTVTGSGGSAPATTYNVTGLTSGVSYTFSVRARDAAGNVSTTSNSITVTTASAPSDIALSNSSIAENSAANTAIGTLSATDINSGDTFTYTLVSGTGSTDNASFSIIGNSLRSAASFDFETKSNYSIRIRVTDSTSLTFEKAFTINVTNVNESAPNNILLSSQTIAENSMANTVIGTLSATDPDAAQTFSFSLPTHVGDNSAFNINGTSLRATNPLNFEAKSSYNVTLRVTDQGGLSFDKSFTITVRDVNEPATQISLSTSTIAENNSANQVVGTFSNNDPDSSQTFTYTLVTGTGDTDNATFNISGNSLRVTNANALNFETKSSLSVRVQVSDGSLSFAQSLSISVSNVNESPSDIVLIPASIAENNTANAVVGALSHNDPDSGQTFTFSLVAGSGDTDNAVFNISGMNVRVTNANALNFESKSSYSVRVQVSDGSLTFAKALTISVSNVNEAANQISLSTSTIAEINSANQVVGTFSNNDPDSSQTFTYTLVTGTGDTDNATFNISGNSLRVTNANALNFETKSSLSVRVQVSDGSLTHAQSFTVTVTNVNEAPTISDIVNQTTNEDVSTGAISFTIGDVDAGTTLSLSGSSSNTTLVPNASIVIGGSGTSRTVTVTPAADQSGTATITVTVSDGTLTATDTFVLTVNAVNDAPTISDIANTSTNMNTATSALSFTVGDVETAAGSFTVSGSSSNTTLVPVANIAFGGSGASRTVTVTPATNQTGTATITVTVSDGSLTATDTFVLTVNANNAPTISNIADQSTNEDTATSAITFTVGDVETAAGSLTVSTSSSNTTLVPSGNISVGGTGASRTVTITPVANQSGTATITVTVSDGLLTATDTFVLTVNAVNDPPTISDIANTSTNMNTATSALSFTVGDVETAVGSLTLTASSINTTLVPIANIAFGGSGASRTVTITPATNQTGTATITVTVSDGTTTTSDTFVLTVNANNAPTITNIADQSTNEDTATSAIAFTIGDVETAAGSLTVSTSSSNTALVPSGNISVGGTGANRTVTITPAANQSGTATITVTVSDGLLTATDTFVLTVNAVNDPPTISDIANTSTNMNTATSALSFTIGDVETATGSLTLTASSSNTTLVPVANIAFGGSGASRTVTVTPTTNQTGTATITVTVSDGTYNFGHICADGQRQQCADD